MTSFCVSHFNIVYHSVAPEPQSGLAVEHWTDLREVVGLRLGGVATFGVRSVGSYACGSMVFSFMPWQPCKWFPVIYFRNSPLIFIAKYNFAWSQTRHYLFLQISRDFFIRLYLMFTIRHDGPPSVISFLIFSSISNMKVHSKNCVQ